jgi:Dyp-type peroxidase family
MPDTSLLTLEIADIQSPILRRRPAPYVGCHVLLRIDDAAAGRELVRRVLPHVVSAADYASRDTWLAIAFTYAGLRALGTPAASLATFPEAFCAGMASRAEALGDVGESAPQHWDSPYGTSDIHIALSLLAVTDEAWQRGLAIAREQLEAVPGVALLVREDFKQMPDGRTQFGYRDGISFPEIAGNGPNPIPDLDAPVAAGEFVLGYPSETGVPSAMPSPDVLGRNGTFLGFRKVHTRVAAFRSFLRDNATAEMGEELLAAKMVGRWRSGAPLDLAPSADDPALGSDLARTNRFDYSGDQTGLRCPRGSHVRRMNPRKTTLEVMTDVKLHRIIRHGATYGPHLPDGVLEDDGVERGIFFIFMSARATETFEFLKAEWINDGNFVGLGRQMDPIAGANDGTGTFTIPKKPVRRRIACLDRFTVTRGGEYAFMPSISALRWLSRLEGSTS